ncbi:hypothetical protein M0R45_017331 [Rubus argutus]|uniref:Uncharacterized protein n=1 Tax=Rubus argutus TaxID=59490 RepID=A0AAW1XVU5_RUBAR
MKLKKLCPEEEEGRSYAACAQRKKKEAACAQRKKKELQSCLCPQEEEERRRSADNDFVDVLFSFLTIPMATIIKRAGEGHDI